MNISHGWFNSEEHLAHNTPWVFSQQLWGCTSSIPQHKLHHTVLPQACASWWCLFVPSPICHEWGTPHRRWVYCTLALGSARLSLVHQLLLSDGELVLPMCWSGFQLSHTPVKRGSRASVSWVKCERQWKERIETFNTFPYMQNNNNPNPDILKHN